MSDELRSKPGHLIWRAYQLTRQLFAEEAASLDITPVQETLMLVLSRRADVDQKTLAEQVALDRSTAGEVIDRLEKRGFITRVENGQDRRARLVSLTPEGKIIFEKLRPIAQRAAEKLLEPLPPLEQSEFIRLLRKVTGMADSFDQVSSTPPAATQLKGKKILCTGLWDLFGQTIVQRLQSEGAEVLELPPFGLEPGGGSNFDDLLAEIFQAHANLELLVIGGNPPQELANIPSDSVYSTIQNVVKTRWLILERVLPYFLRQQHGRLINLALFPAMSTLGHNHAATVAANSSIVTLSKLVADDYRHLGIISNSISPRLRSEPLLDPLFENRSTKSVDVPAIDAALAVCYLASDAARRVSASNIVLG